MLQPNITRRKFYNKWIYKVSYRIPGISILRMFSIDSIENFSYDKNKTNSSTYHKAGANYEFIKKLTDFLLTKDVSLWSKRIERDSIDIYSNDKEIYQDLKKLLPQLLISCSEPKEEFANDLLCENNKVFVKQYPHKKYKHKAFLLPHKLLDVKEKYKYLEWIDSQGDKVLISDTVKKWFIATNWNWDRRYVLVEDQSTLLMLKLRNPEVLGRVHDYVIADK